MVKYADIAKDRLKPFDDDFESKVKLATKVKGLNDKTTATFKWANGISAKVEQKTAFSCPFGLLGDHNLKQTFEFAQNDATITSEFTQGDQSLQGKWKVDGAKVAHEYTLRKAFGDFVAGATAKLSGNDMTWTANGAFETKADDQTTVQVGAQVNNDYAPELSLGVLSGAFGNLMFKTDMKKHASASLFPLNFLDMGYDMSVGHSASHTASEALQNPALVLVAANKEHTLKVKCNDFMNNPSPQVSLITKAPVAFTGTWTWKANASVFGVNFTL